MEKVEWKISQGRFLGGEVSEVWVAVPGLSGCGGRGLLSSCGAQASPCSGSPAVEHEFQGARASVVVMCQFSTPQHVDSS